MELYGLAGHNICGELGNGTNTSSASFVQGRTEKKLLENVLMIGKNNGNISGSWTAGYSLNTAVILDNGDIYVTGDNTYGQLGNGSTGNTNYYVQMGNVKLDYEDKPIVVDENGYKVDKAKVKYIQNTINAYNNDKAYAVGELEYTLLNTALASIDENGNITAKTGISGATKLKIKDITNDYETYVPVIVNRLVDTDTVMYIYNIEDLVRFRDSVNSGDNYAGKSVYLMVDLDLSEICGAGTGSWEAIGKTVPFAGNFDGNFHTISNLYIKGSYVKTGLFAQNSTTSVIKNIILDNVYIDNNYGTPTSGNNVGGISGINRGSILNCGIESGTISTKRTVGTSGTNWMLTRARRNCRRFNWRLYIRLL